MNLLFAAAKRVSENNLVSFNPLFLFGGVGIRKDTFNACHSMGY